MKYLSLSLFVISTSSAFGACDFERAAEKVALDAFTIRTAQFGEAGIDGRIERIEALNSSGSWYVALADKNGENGQRYVFDLNQNCELVRGNFRALVDGEDAK